MDLLSSRLVERVYRQLGADGALLVERRDSGLSSLVSLGLPAVPGFPFGCGLAQRCVQSGQLHRASAGATLPPEAQSYWQTLSLAEGLALPLRSSTGTTLGALALYARLGGAFTSQAEDRALVVAEALASLLERRDEYQQREAQRLAVIEVSERRFQSFMAEAPMLAWVKDGEGRYRFANAAFEREMGVTPGSIIGQTDEFYLPPELVRPLQENDTRVRVERMVLRTAEFVPRPGEAPREWWVIKFPMEGPGGQVFTGGMAFDRSELRQAEASVRTLEQQLHQSEVDLRLVVDSLADAVLISREALILYANHAMVKLLGAASPGALQGRSIFELVHPDDLAQAGESIATVRKTGQVQTEGRLLCLDGRTVRVDLVANQISFGGKPAVASVMRDITLRRTQQEQAQLTARLVSIGTLSSGVAHEINNPLAYVLANLTLVTGSLADKTEPLTAEVRAELAELASDALHGAERIRRIVAGLRTLGRGRNGATPRVRLSLPEVLRTAIDLTGNEIRHRARLVTDLQPVPLVEADETQLVQVFVNLLANAAQAIEQHAANRHTVTVTCFTDATGHAAAEVRDDGSGIKPEHLPRIFDPFFTTKSVNEGMGLGLSMTHGLVAGFGGAITVHSEPGVGTTFRVTLPPAEGPLELAAQGDPPPRAKAPARRVLVIDDDVDVAKALARSLSSHHQVVLAHTGEEALARPDLDRFDALLCDVMMPGLDGLQVYERLRGAHPAIAARLVFMTGGVFSGEVQRALEAAGRPVLEKPFELARVEQLIASVPLE